MRGRSVKLLPLSFRTYSRQLTPPSLFSAPKTSFGSGTTTSSTFLENCFTSTFCELPRRGHRAKVRQEAAGRLEILANGIIGTVRLLISPSYSGLMANTKQKSVPHKFTR